MAGGRRHLASLLLRRTGVVDGGAVAGRSHYVGRLGLGLARMLTDGVMEEGERA
jgi:hypothetical protein